MQNVYESLNFQNTSHTSPSYDVYCEDVRQKWAHYTGTALYFLQV